MDVESGIKRVRGAGSILQSHLDELLRGKIRGQSPGRLLNAFCADVKKVF